MAAHGNRSTYEELMVQRAHFASTSRGKFSFANPAAARRRNDLGGHVPPVIVESGLLCNLCTQMGSGDWATDPHAKKGLEKSGSTIGKRHEMQNEIWGAELGTMFGYSSDTDTP